jgi:hypothetical protein
MPAIEYTDADDDVIAVLRDQLRHHPDLTECGAVIGVVIARAEDGPAVKHHGVAALATVKVVSTKDRTKKRIDAEMLIDGGEWDRLSEAQQAALIDHELSHLRRNNYKEKVLAKLRKGNPDHPAWKLDCHGRPRLKTVAADFTPGDAFASVIARHGDAAVEYVGARRFHEFARTAREAA